MQNGQNNRRALLPQNQIDAFIAQHADWRLENQSLQRSASFSTYLDGVAFINRAAELAEEADHHPDLHLFWRKVDMVLSTHDAGGVTQLDLDLAARLDSALRVYSV